MLSFRVFSRANPSRSTAANSFRSRSYGKRRILHYFGANKSFRIRSYRNCPRNPFRIRSYENTGGGGTPTLPRLPRAHLAKGCKNSETATLTTFRINTCKSVSKQRTLTPLRINTYKKPGEGGVPTLPRVQRPASSIRPPEPYAPRGASIPCALTRLRILPVTTGLLWWGCTPSAPSYVAPKRKNTSL